MTQKGVECSELIVHRDAQRLEHTPYRVVGRAFAMSSTLTNRLAHHLGQLASCGQFTVGMRVHNRFGQHRSERLVGIVTKFDFLRNFIFTPQSMVPHYAELMQRRVGDIMRRKPTSVASDAPLPRVLQLMVDMTIKSFPVVAGERVVGIISREDVIRALRRAVGRG